MSVSIQQFILLFLNIFKQFPSAYVAYNGIIQCYKGESYCVLILQNCVLRIIVMLFYSEWAIKYTWTNINLGKSYNNRSPFIEYFFQN